MGLQWGLITGPIVGLICGVLAVALAQRMTPPSPAVAAEYSLLELTAVIAYPLCLLGGILGALTGALTAAVPKRWAGLGIALLLGCGSGLMLANVPQPSWELILAYALPCCLTCWVAANRVSAIQ